MFKCNFFFTLYEEINTNIKNTNLNCYKIKKRKKKLWNIYTGIIYYCRLRSLNLYLLKNIKFTIIEILCQQNSFYPYINKLHACFCSRAFGIFLKHRLVIYFHPISINHDHLFLKKIQCSKLVHERMCMFLYT